MFCFEKKNSIVRYFIFIKCIFDCLFPILHSLIKKAYQLYASTKYLQSKSKEYRSVAVFLVLMGMNTFIAGHEI